MNQFFFSPCNFLTDNPLCVIKYKKDTSFSYYIIYLVNKQVSFKQINKINTYYARIKMINSCIRNIKLYSNNNQRCMRMRKRVKNFIHNCNFNTRDGFDSIS